MEARELEIEHISRSLNLKAVRNARSRPAISRGGKSKRREQAPESASSHLASQRSQTPLGAPSSGIEGVSQTVAPPTPSQDGASQTTKTQLGVIPQESPVPSQAHSDTREVEPPQIEDISSEGELPDSDSDQEDHSGTPVLHELLMGREELEDYDSFNSSPVVYKTPLWKFTEQTPSGAQAQTRTSTATS